MRTAEAAAHARYRAASIALALGEAQTARAEATALVRSAPATLGARRALLLLRALRREEAGPAAEADFLLGIASGLRAPVERAILASAPPHTTRELYVECLVEAARIRLVDRRQAKSAAKILQRAEASATGSSWLDDARIWRARALRAAGDRVGALSVYRRLIDAQESSWFVGSYDSTFLDEAMLEEGLTLVALGRTDEAREAYARLLDDLPTSRLVDDAAFELARLEAQVGDDGAWRRFVEQYPRSRLRRDARRLMESK